VQAYLTNPLHSVSERVVRVSSMATTFEDVCIQHSKDQAGANETGGECQVAVYWCWTKGNSGSDLVGGEVDGQPKEGGEFGGAKLSGHRVRKIRVDVSAYL
jgi:hypothetical protein